MCPSDRFVLHIVYYVFTSSLQTCTPAPRKKKSVHNIVLTGLETERDLIPEEELAHPPLPGSSDRQRSSSGSRLIQDAPLSSTHTHTKERYVAPLNKDLRMSGCAQILAELVLNRVPSFSTAVMVRTPTTMKDTNKPESGSNPNKVRK